DPRDPAGGLEAADEPLGPLPLRPRRRPHRRLHPAGRRPHLSPRADTALVAHNPVRILPGAQQEGPAQGVFLPGRPLATSCARATRVPLRALGALLGGVRRRSPRNSADIASDKRALRGPPSGWWGGTVTIHDEAGTVRPLTLAWVGRHLGVGERVVKTEAL